MKGENTHIHLCCAERKATGCADFRLFARERWQKSSTCCKHIRRRHPRRQGPQPDYLYPAQNTNYPFCVYAITRTCFSAAGFSGQLPSMYFFSFPVAAPLLYVYSPPKKALQSFHNFFFSTNKTTFFQLHCKTWSPERWLLNYAQEFRTIYIWARCLYHEASISPFLHNIIFFGGLEFCFFAHIFHTTFQKLTHNLSGTSLFSFHLSHPAGSSLLLLSRTALNSLAIYSRVMEQVVSFLRWLLY